MGHACIMIVFLAFSIVEENKRQRNLSVGFAAGSIDFQGH